MRMPLQISFRGLHSGGAADAVIRRRAEALNHFYDRIMGCRVIVERPHLHSRKGHLYQVRIDLTVPGGEIVVQRAPALDRSREDLCVAIRDTFDAARRLLQDHARRRRAEVKTHVGPRTGRVGRLFPDYGFIVTPDGEEIYFHANSVVGDRFSYLDAGAEVRFCLHEGEGEKGAQASSVVPIGRRH